MPDEYDDDDLEVRYVEQSESGDDDEYAIMLRQIAEQAAAERALSEERKQAAEQTEKPPAEHPQPIIAEPSASPEIPAYQQASPAALLPNAATQAPAVSPPSTPMPPAPSFTPQPAGEPAESTPLKPSNAPEYPPLDQAAPQSSPEPRAEPDITPDRPGTMQPQPPPQTFQYMAEDELGNRYFGETEAPRTDSPQIPEVRQPQPQSIDDMLNRPFGNIRPPAFQQPRREAVHSDQPPDFPQDTGIGGAIQVNVQQFFTIDPQRAGQDLAEMAVEGFEQAYGEVLSEMRKKLLATQVDMLGSSLSYRQAVEMRSYAFSGMRSR